jgi:hypothetical protein
MKLSTTVMILGFRNTPLLQHHQDWQTYKYLRRILLQVPLIYCSDILFDRVAERLIREKKLSNTYIHTCMHTLYATNQKVAGSIPDEVNF